MSLDEVVEKFGERSWTETAYWLGCRQMFELVYANKDILLKEFPQRKALIEGICSSRSESEFLLALREFATEKDLSAMAVLVGEDGEPYLA